MWDESHATIDILSREYPIAIREKKQLDRLLEEFETGRNRSVAMQQNLETSTQKLGRKVADLEDLFQQCFDDIPKGSRDLWKRRVKSLRDDLDTFRGSLKTQLDHIFRVREDERERKRLLGGIAKRKENLDGMEYMSKERSNLTESLNLLESITQQGRNIVGNLFNQNVTLKNAQKRVLDFRNSLGISTSLITVVERRHSLDRLLVYGCMLLVILVFCVLYYVVRIRTPATPNIM